MKIAIFAAAASMAATGLAFAADMPLMAPPVARVMTWTGFYIGLNAGDTWDNNDSVDTLGLPIQGFPDGVGSGSFASNSAAVATGSTSFGNGNNGRFIGGGQIGTIGNLGKASPALRQTLKASVHIPEIPYLTTPSDRSRSLPQGKP